MKILTMSFDDGTVQDRKLIAMLEQYGMRATFHLNSGFFGQKHQIVHDGILCDHTELTEEEALLVYQNQEVAVHTVHHPDLTRLTEEEILFEVQEDQKYLEEMYKQKIIGMAYPGGGKPYNDDVIQTISQNTTIRFAQPVEYKMNSLLSCWKNLSRSRIRKM